MRYAIYMGGKFRQSKHIMRVLCDLGINGESTYIEPFCGAMWSATKVIDVVKPKKVILSDINKFLIIFWKYMVKNDSVKLPSVISDIEYNKYKVEKPDHWLTAWYGFGLSFGGKWFGGVARDKKGKRNFCKEGGITTIRKANILKQAISISIFCVNYETYVGYKDTYFYLDPPYEDRTKAHHFDKFDHIKFWEFARCLSLNNVVIVTCFECPNDFKTLHNFGDTVVRHHSSKGKDGTIEKIVMYNKGKENI